MSLTTKTLPRINVEVTKTTPTVVPDFGRASILRVEITGATLNGANRTRLAQIAGYAWKEHVRGLNTLDDFMVDSHGVTFFDAHLSLSRRTHIELAWEDFVEAVAKYVREGTPVRTTSRSGPGTQGTRLVEAVEYEGLPGAVTLSIWVDHAKEIERPLYAKINLAKLTQQQQRHLRLVLGRYGAEVTEG